MQQVFTGIIREDILRIDRADKRFSRATSANATAQRLIKRARSLCCLSVPENDFVTDERDAVAREEIWRNLATSSSDSTECQLACLSRYSYGKLPRCSLRFGM
eukprot:TRINITY_DN934_c0_g1_i3.p2 TRINITY_DN934_c0_g1~~TRINITY_DN934_c0_g1_i3.p2  ORF type:complete len:103 (-),score=15.10 TRINITY_DN934_c0_g1_i3:121-429(-)